MAMWRYIGYLMGIPETILFRNEEETLRVFRIGGMVEPPISLESIAMANSLIASAPYVAGTPDHDARVKLTDYAYKLSRALIGDSLADELKYPDARSLGVLLNFRNLGRLRRIMGKSFPKLVNNPYTCFTGLLEVSAYDEAGISYRSPDHVYGGIQLLLERGTWRPALSGMPSPTEPFSSQRPRVSAGERKSPGGRAIQNRRFGL